MIVFPHTDKVRFVDLAPSWVHTVEFSDAKSNAYFITAWITGPAREIPAAAVLLSLKPELDHHDPTVYHRDDEAGLWVDTYFRRKVRQAWTNHFHWRFGHTPGLVEWEEVLKDVGNGASSGLDNEIRTYFGGRT